MVLENGFIVHHRWIEHDYRHHDACFAQIHAFVLHCHGKVVATGILQGFCDFVATCAIAAGLHHCHCLGVGAEERTEKFEVVRQGIEVHFFHGLVLLGRKQVNNLAKFKIGGTFHQDGFVFEIACRFFVEELRHTFIEFGVDAIEISTVGTHFPPDANQVLDVLAF